MISLCVSQVASVQTRGASFFSSRWTLASTGGKVWDMTALLCQLSIAWSLTDNSKPLLIPQFYCFGSSWQSCSVAIKRRNSWPRNDDDHTEITKVRVYYFIYLKGCWPEWGWKPPHCCKTTFYRNEISEYWLKPDTDPTLTSSQALCRLIVFCKVVWKNLILGWRWFVFCLFLFACTTFYKK